MDEDQTPYERAREAANGLTDEIMLLAAEVHHRQYEAYCATGFSKLEALILTGWQAFGLTVSK